MRGVALALCVAGWVAIARPEAPLTGPAEANAAVAIALTLEELVESSPRAVIAVAAERRSTWEELGGARRIVTYTRLKVIEDVYGGGAKEVWVRTLGGAVGRIGQHVSGEAVFVTGERSLLFLGRDGDGSLYVTGMAQGQYLVRRERRGPDDAGVERLRVSSGTAMLVPRRKKGGDAAASAREQLAGTALTESVATIRRVKNKVDARRAKP